MASRVSMYSLPGGESSPSSSSATAGTSSQHRSSTPIIASTNSMSSTSSLATASSSAAAAGGPMTRRVSGLPPQASSGSALAPSRTASSTILERNLGKTRGSEVSYGAWAFLFSEIVVYTQRRVAGISDFEARLSSIGYSVGARLGELLPLRDSLPASTSRGANGPPRHTRLLPVLQYVHTTLFRYLFGRPASSLERSTENEDEYMIGDDDPVLDKGVQVPREMSSLSPNALLAGLVEAVMDGLGFPSRVTSHLVPSEQHPRRNVLLIKLQPEVMERESALAGAK